MQTASLTVTHTIKWPRPWLARTIPLAFLLIPQLNEVMHDVFGGPAEVQEQVQISGAEFDSLNIATPYLLDESPSGSYDFTLIDPATDSVHVKVPSPCKGSVIDSGYWGGYGNALDLQCDDGTLLRFAHFAGLDVVTGGAVEKGQSLGDQGSTGNSTGEHVHLEVTLPGHAMSDRSATLPYVEDVLFPFWESGIKHQKNEHGLPVAFDINNGDRSDEVNAIFHAAINLDVKDPYQIAYILATAQHESASFSTLHEIGMGPGCGAGYDYDGWTGVGLVQLTWKGNFQRAQEKLGFADMSTEQFCQEVATRPDVAATILIRGMMEGWFTGLSLPEFVAGGSVNYIGARRTVNGTDRASHIAAIAQNYEVQVKQWLKEYGL